jgi:hypothetical protein
MIKKKDLETYLVNETNEYFFISFVHNRKKNVIKDKWQPENRNFATAKYVRSLNSIIKEYCEDSFRVGLERINFSWAPNFLKVSKEIKEYLKEKGIDKKDYKGIIYEKDLEKFIKLFINYPLDYHYQNIEIYALKTNYVIVFDHHGVTWIIHDNKFNLIKIANKLKKLNVKMILDNKLKRGANELG